MVFSAYHVRPVPRDRLRQRCFIMKFNHIIIQTVESLGYFLLRADEWGRLQQRLATAEETLRANSELKQRIAQTEEAHRVVSDQLEQRLAETEKAHRVVSDQLKQRLAETEETHRVVSDQLKQRLAETEQRLAETEEAHRVVSDQLKQRLSETEEAHRVVSDQLKQQEQLRALDSADAAAKFADLEKRLGECVNGRHLLTLRMGRVEARVQALKRRRDHLQTELRFSREQISRVDTSGRIQELEAENRRLWQRISDLEVYLQETRGSSRPYYL
jgi:chromosome segregation ATPase